MTLDLSVNILALSAAGEQLHEVDVVLQRTTLVLPMTLAAHQLDEHLERLLVVVEEQHVVANVQQLQESREAVKTTQQTYTTLD